MTEDRQRPGDDLDRSAAAAAHALDTTDAVEATAAEEAAERSDTAREELDSFRETASMLGLAAAPVEPSPRLRDELMAKIALTPQLPRDESAARNAETADSALADLGLVDSVPLDADDPALTPASSSSPEVAAREGVSPAEERARRRWFQRPAMLLGGIAAAAALLIGGGFVGSAITTSVTDPSAVTASAERLAAITSAPDSQSARANVDDGSTATVVWSQALGSSAVLVDGLSALPSDRTYEAWYIGSDQVTAAGTFDAGDSTTWHVLDGTMGSGDAIAVTVEPAGGSDQPTTVPILVVETA